MAFSGKILIKLVMSGMIALAAVIFLVFSGFQLLGVISGYQDPVSASFSVLMVGIFVFAVTFLLLTICMKG